MNILVIGAGGRESAIIRALSKNTTTNIYGYIPSDSINIPDLYTSTLIFQYKDDLLDFTCCVDFCKQHNIGYAIIGSETYLNMGIVDLLELNDIKCIGPNASLARIETSKNFARQIIDNCDLGKYSPDYISIDKYTDGVADKANLSIFLTKHDNNVAVKADGLHGGKGVKLFGEDLHNRNEILDYIKSILSTNEEVEVEEKLVGQEFSLITMTDGNTCKHFPPVQDYKRLNDDNTGPNTGSMGCIYDTDGKLWFLTDDLVKQAEIINDTIIKNLNSEVWSNYKKCSSKYKGFLYGSFMVINEDNVKKLKIIEFNARLGDPEAIVLLDTLDTDFSNICQSIGDGTLQNVDVQFNNKPKVCKYLVPIGYPNNPKKREKITMRNLNKEERESLYYASIGKGWAEIQDLEQSIYTLGSRSIAICCDGADLHDAENKANLIASTIINENPNIFHFRTNLISSYLTIKDCGLYEQSGVNINEGNKAVARIGELVKDTYNASVVSELGAFGGMYDLGTVLKTYENPVLVSSIDGVGTKSVFSIDQFGLDGFEMLGEDIVNHSVNDILVQGAKPLYFLDYFATSILKSNELYHFIKGVNKSCKEANCVLIGGETAEMPNIYEKNRHDLVGNIVGVVERNKIINGRNTIKSKDVLIGIPSSGPHTNGFSLIRNIYKTNPGAFTKDIITRLATPHRSYLKEFDLLVNNTIDIHGLCHITGGGFNDNISRVLPENTTITYESFDFSPIFKFLQKTGSVSDKEMKKVFNCGYGLVVFVAPDDVHTVLGLIDESKILGYVD